MQHMNLHPHKHVRMYVYAYCMECGVEEQVSNYVCMYIFSVSRERMTVISKLHMQQNNAHIIILCI